MISAAADISVLTPSYGYGRFIGDCIGSVAGQEGIEAEHIVQDAGSTDQTSEILHAFDGRVDWRSEPDEGQSDALNKALSRATGRWVAWLNADEYYLPGALAALVECGDRTGADLVYGETVFVDEEGRFERLVPQHRFHARILREYGCFIASSSMIVRHDVLGPHPWDTAVKRIMDWDLYMKLLTKGAKFARVVRPIGAFRRHDEQVTNSEWWEWVDEDAFVSAKYGLPTDPHERWRATRPGRWMHRAYKLGAGSYLRQRQAQRLQGRTLRWFDDDAGSQTFAELLAASYPRAKASRAS